jgi:hypothetical protein
MNVCRFVGDAAARARREHQQRRESKVNLRVSFDFSLKKEKKKLILKNKVEKKDSYVEILINRTNTFY